MSKKKEEKMETENQLHTVTGRFNDPLFAKMQEWLKKNDFSTNQLLARAVERYISEAQVLEPVEVVPASDDQVGKAIKRLSKTHKRALDELK